MEYQRKNQGSGKWKAIIITFSVIGAILLGGGLIYFLTKKSTNPSQQTNLGEQQNQQTQNAVLQLAGNLLDNSNNLNQLTKKPDGTAKTIQEIEEEFLISAYSPKSTSNKAGISEKLPPEVIERIWWELRPWIEEYLRDPNQSILDHAREKFRRDVENWLRWQRREYNRQLEEYQKRLRELKKIEDLIREYQKIREQELLDKISRKTELRNKGYVDRDIEKLREWDLLDQEIPDLTAEKRIGATNILYTREKGGKKIGGSNDLVIFLKPKKAKNRDPRTEINIDINQKQTSQMAINFSVNIQGHHPQKGYRFKDYYEQIIRDFLTEKGKNNNDAYVFIRQEIPSNVSGDSAGIGFYLTLYSLTNQIPLPSNLGSTGTVEGEKIGPIGGLKTKIKWNVDKENPINIFILSEANLNINGYENFYRKGARTSEPEENWFENFPSSLKEKPKQVHFISQKKQIEITLQEILNNPNEKIIHSCGKSEVRNKLPQEPEPKNMEFRAMPEQLLALLFDGGFCGVSRDQERQQKEKGVAAPPASAELGPLQNILDVHFKQAGSTEKVKNLYNEYKQKLGSNSADEWYKNQLAQLKNQSQNQENSKANSEKLKEIQAMIGKLKQEAVQKKQNYEHFKAISEQNIAELQKQIEGQKQAKANEEVILQKIDLDIEEAKRAVPAQDTQDLENSKNEINQRITQLTTQISANEKQIADLKQEIEKRLQENSVLEVQIERLELQLQELISQNQGSSSQEIQNKKQEIEQEYRRRQAENNQNVEKLYREYETKFKKNALSLTNLIPNIQKQLTELGYQKLVITWKSTSFGQVHLTTTEPSVNLEIVKNR